MTTEKFRVVGIIKDGQGVEDEIDPPTTPWFNNYERALAEKRFMEERDERLKKEISYRSLIKYYKIEKECITITREFV